MSEKRPLIAISGGFGNANSGDEALIVAMRDDLRERIPNARIVAFSDNVEVSSRLVPDLEFTYSGRFGVREPGQRGAGAIAWLPRMFRLLARADVLLTGGGTILQDATHRFFVPFWFAKIALAQLLGTPTVFFGIGAGPLERRSSAILMRLFGRRVRFSTLRGPLSEEWMLHMGMPEERIEVTADPAVTLRAASDEDVLRALAAEGVRLSENRMTIGLCVREWYKLHGSSLTEKDWGPGQRERYERVVDAFAGLVRTAAERHDAEVVFIPMSIQPPNDDRAAADAVVERARAAGVEPNRMHVVRSEHDPGLVKGFLGHCDIVVAMRFHPLIYATTQGVPVLGVAYGLKTRDYMRYLDLEEWVLDIDEVDAEALSSMFDGLVARLDEVQLAMEERVKEVRSRAARNVDVVEAVIAGGRPGRIADRGVA